MKLSDESKGIVLRNDVNDLFCPHILIVRSPDGTKMHEETRLTGCSRSSEAARHIVELLDPAREGIRIEDYVGQEDTASPLDEFARLTEK